jgi:hypothetical protein
VAENFPTKSKELAEDLASLKSSVITPPLDEAVSTAHPIAQAVAEPSYSESLEAKAASALRLSSLKGPSSMKPKAAFQLLSPSVEPVARKEQNWSAVLSWIVLSTLPWPDENAASAALFDKLRLRLALADTFLSLGIENERAWRMAAQIRFLVLHRGAFSTTLMRSQTLWDDPDIRWLAGVHEYLGQTYVNKEQVEELAAWLQLPTWLGAPQQSSGTPELQKLESLLTETCETLQQSGYNLQTYLSSSGVEEDRKQAL